MCHVEQEARHKAWVDVQKEWDQGEPKWQVQVDGIQICLQASQHAGGRFMLAADNANLAGRHLKSQGLNAIHLDMDKVQIFEELWLIADATDQCAQS